MEITINIWAFYLIMVLAFMFGKFIQVIIDLPKTKIIEDVKKYSWQRYVIRNYEKSNCKYKYYIFDIKTNEIVEKYDEHNYSNMLWDYINLNNDNAGK